MNIPDVIGGHLGKKIVRIRELRGIKQETLAASLGISQQAVSKMEQSEDIDEEKLKKVADILGVTVETIRQFNEETAINNINTFNDSSAFNFQCQFNPLDKIVELYERLLKSEREKNELLEKVIKKLEK